MEKPEDESGVIFYCLPRNASRNLSTESEEEISDAPRPGAYHVPGIGDRSNPSGPTPHLPQARMIIEEVDQTIVDGIVVRKKKVKAWTYFERALVFGTIVAATISAVFGIRQIQKAMFYNKIKKIVLQISDEESLNDKTSIQYFSWQYTADVIPRLENSKEFMTDEENVIIRYLSVLVPIGTLAVYEWHNDVPYEDICEAFTCNEDKEIIDMVLMNTVTKRGGGRIVTEIGRLHALEKIVLSRDALIGTIPTEIGLLKHLHTLDLSKNFLTGTIPTELGQLERLEWLFLQDNLLEGTIPEELANIENLKIVNVGQNSLTGTLPPTMSTLTNLESFTMTQTNIGGSLDFLCPLNFTNGTYFQEMDLWFVSMNFRFNYTGKMGVIVDCVDGESILDCGCCSC